MTSKPKGQEPKPIPPRRTVYDESQDELYERGRLAGERFAAAHPISSELMRLTRAIDAKTYRGLSFVTWASIISPESKCHDFWMAVSGGDPLVYREENYVRGFLEAAAQQAEDQVFQHFLTQVCSVRLDPRPFFRGTRNDCGTDRT